MADALITTLSTRETTVDEYSADLINIQVHHEKEIYEYMSQDVINNNTLENEKRFILPNSRDFNFDCTANPLPVGTLEYDYAKGDGIPNVFVQWMYQHAAIASKGNRSTLSEVFGGASFVGFSGIFESLANCVCYGFADFKMSATKIGGVIFMNWNRLSGAAKVAGVQKPKSYRFVPSVLEYGSKLKRKGISMLTIALTDEYKENGDAVEVKESSRTLAQYWNNSGWCMTRSLQHHFMMEIGGLKVIKYKLANDDELEKTKDQLLTKGMGDNGSGRTYTRMKTILAKVLLELQGNLKEGKFCEIDFDKNTGRLTITYEGHIDGPVFLTEFKNVFEL